MLDEIKNATITQINMSYNAVEDRLAFRIGMSNQTELMVWVTRRIAKLMWHILNKTTMAHGSVAETHSPQAAQMLQHFAKESAAQKFDYTEPYEARSTINQDEMFLSQDCNLSTADNGIESLHLICTNGQTVNIVLNEALIYAILNMLQLISKEADWGISATTQPASVSAFSASKALH